MQALLGFARRIDALTTAIGRTVAWLVVVAAGVSAFNAVMRKLFHMSSNSWLEAQWWLFACVFLLASPWTLARNEHIRIDVLSSRFPKSGRNAVELIGHVFFLIPTAALILYTSWHYFLTSFAQNEQSTNPGGLPVWPIKALIPVAFALLLAQGISELIKRVAIMRGVLPEIEVRHGYHVEAAEAGIARSRDETRGQPPGQG